MFVYSVNSSFLLPMRGFTCYFFCLPYMPPQRILVPFSHGQQVVCLSSWHSLLLSILMCCLLFAANAFAVEIDTVSGIGSLAPWVPWTGSFAFDGFLLCRSLCCHDNRFCYPK